MKNYLLILSIALLNTIYLNAQSITFTSPELTEAEIGTTITVDFEYTVSNDGYIYCAIELLDDFDYVSTVADAELNPAPAGTDVAGSFDLSIPDSTTPASELTGNLNYKIKIELQDGNFQYLTGEFPSTEINLFETMSNDVFLGNDSFSVYPNPANEYIEINGINNNLISDIVIYNSLGKKVYYTETIPENNQIDVSRLKTGLYFISILSQNNKQTHTFIKK